MRHLAVFLSLLFLLGGCASTPNTNNRAKPSKAWLSSTAGLKTLTVWEAISRASINHSVYHVSGTLVQQTRPEMDLLNFRIAPTGQTMMSKMYPDGSVIAVMPDGKTLRGNDANQLFYRMTRFNLPARELKQWLLGLVPAGAEHGFKPNGELDYFRYRNWHVQYGPLKQQGPYLLPRTIYLNHGESTKIKIVVTTWQIPDCPCNND